MAATASFNQYFPGYEILGELGRGNARVLKVRHRQCGDYRAIKHFAFNTDAETLQRFQRESEIMTAIQHPHVVKVHEVQLEAELPYIVMELVEGGDLRKRLKQEGVPDLQELIRMAGQLVEALEYIHAREVVHRDIKPENIMYRRLAGGEWQYLLTDFGIAKLREQSHTLTGSSLLTYEYASPEQFTDSRRVEAATDYYSLGVVLFECITGRVPFEYEEGNLLLHINRVISHPVDLFQLPPALPPSLHKLLQGLLQKRANERLADPSQIRLLLQAASRELRQTTIPAAAPVPQRKTLPANNRLNRYGYETILPSLASVKGTVQMILPARHRSAFFPFFVLLLLMVTALGAYLVWGSIFRGFPITEKFVNTGASAEGTQNKASVRTVPVSHSNPGVQYPVHPVKDRFYFDDFSKPGDSGWEKGGDAQKDFVFENGKYLIKGYDSNYTYQSTQRFDINTDKNWSVTVNASRLGGSAPEGFGLNYLSNPDKESYFVFYISSDGYYKIEAKERDSVTTLVDWTRTYNIHPDNAMNMLSVIRRGEALQFFINDVKEVSLPFQGAFGNGFGLRVDGNQTVAFDQFMLKGEQ